MKRCRTNQYEIDGLAQDCSNSIANALELLQSCTKPSNVLCLQTLTDELREGAEGCTGRVARCFSMTAESGDLLFAQMFSPSLA